jgi:FAD/FMN-containing dehydrogenase
MTRLSRQQILAHLKELAGPGGYLDERGDIEPFEVDFRKLYRGSTPLVLRPDSTGRISDILKFCNETRTSIVPVGGNTGYCGGATPDESGSQVVLSLSRLNKIRSKDPLNYTLTAEAGCTLVQVHEAARQVQRLFPLSMGSEGSCQLGGNLSTNAGGTAVLRYGNTRDLVLGIEAVLPDGSIVENLKGLRKDNTGYDWKNMFIGAEGTLGIITAAVLKLFPMPRSYGTAMVALRDLDASVELLSMLRERSADAVTTFELIPRLAVELTVQHIEGVKDPLDRPYDWYVMMELSCATEEGETQALLERLLGEAYEQGIVLDAALASSGSQRQAMWRMRENIPEAQSHEGPSIKHDVSVQVSRMPAFIVEATRLVRSLVPGCRVVSYGHLGDGNVHFNLSPAEGDRDPVFLEQAKSVSHAVHELIAEFGGSISAEHGIGRLKRDELALYKSESELRLMKAVKAALDPLGIMNPGKVI